MISRLVYCFIKSFPLVFDKINHNTFFLNWSITKFIIINNTKVGARHPVNIELEKNLIEAVYKLFGCTIDDKLHFYKYVKNLKSAVWSKLFRIKKKLFFLLFDIQVPLLLPRFYYSSALFAPLILYSISYFV